MHVAAVVLLLFAMSFAPVDDASAPPHLQRLANGWKTDWGKSGIDLKELVPGCPQRDCIPPIDKPQFVDIKSAGAWLEPQEQVITVTVGDESRAYPIRILIRHEIVNDVIAGVPVVISYCPLCNSAMVFDRRVGDHVLRFGVAGVLRNSDLVMWDDATESLWQQITAEGIVGEMTGKRLTFVPSGLVSFESYRSAHPTGSVLSTETGFDFKYGTTRYDEYDKPDSAPISRFFTGEIDDRLKPKERVLTFHIGDKPYAINGNSLMEKGVLQQTLDGTPIVAFMRPGMSSALETSSVAGGRDIGETGLFKATVEGKSLTFKRTGAGFVDEQTGSKWNIFGECIDGSRKGVKLERIPSGDHLWFAWSSFYPETALIE